MADEFRDMLLRLRAGDEVAVHQFVRDYQPIVTLAIRGRLKRTRLRASLDTADVFQSAIISLLRRLSQGQFAGG